MRIIRVLVFVITLPQGDSQAWSSSTEIAENLGGLGVGPEQAWRATEAAWPGLQTSQVGGISGLVSCLGNSGSEAGLLLQTRPEHLVMRGKEKGKPEPPTGSDSLHSAVSERAALFRENKCVYFIPRSAGRNEAAQRGSSWVCSFQWVAIGMLKCLTHWELIFYLSSN